MYCEQISCTDEAETGRTKCTECYTVDLYGYCNTLECINPAINEGGMCISHKQTVVNEPEKDIVRMLDNDSLRDIFEQRMKKPAKREQLRNIFGHQLYKTLIKMKEHRREHVVKNSSSMWDCFNNATRKLPVCTNINDSELMILTEILNIVPYNDE